MADQFFKVEDLEPCTHDPNGYLPKVRGCCIKCYHRLQYAWKIGLLTKKEAEERGLCKPPTTPTQRVAAGRAKNRNGHNYECPLECRR